jgi:rod shape-determining protein MreD
MKFRLIWIVYVIVIVFLTLLQTSFLPQFDVCRTKPDLILLFVVSIGLLTGYKEGVFWGAVSGLVTASVFQNIWGVYMLAYCLAGFVSGLVSEKVEPDNFIIPLASGTALSAGSVLIFILSGHYLELFYPSTSELFKILTFLAWNAAFSMPVFLFTKYFLTGADRESRKKSSGVRNEYIIG